MLLEKGASMRNKCLIMFVLMGVAAGFAWSQETPKSMVDTYDALADSILALKRAEAGFVRSMLDGHRHGAEAFMRAGDFRRAAAEIALFASEGDNAIGGVRKRLVEGGHHHNADGEAKGIYEPGFVVVTRKAKQQALAASAALLAAKTDEERKTAWQQFVAVADSLEK
jgi:hypothetical protein